MLRDQHYYINSDIAFSSVGKALGAFWPGRDTGTEPANCVGGGEHRSTAGSRCDQTVRTSVKRLLWCSVIAEVAANTRCFGSLLVTRVGEDSAVTGRELIHRQLQKGFVRVPWEWWAGKMN